jgi:hypothetical protein
VLAQDVEPELVRPPVARGGTATSDVGCLHGTLAFRHDYCGSSVCERERLDKSNVS